MNSSMCYVIFGTGIKYIPALNIQVQRHHILLAESRGQRACVSDPGETELVHLMMPSRPCQWES